MKRTSLIAFLAAVGIWLALNGVAGWILRRPMFLQAPVAYLAGDRDGITPLEGVRSVAGPGADLTVVPGVDHLEAGRTLSGTGR